MQTPGVRSGDSIQFQAERWLNLLSKWRENKTGSADINLTMFPTLSPKEEVCVRVQSPEVFILGGICDRMGRGCVHACVCVTSAGKKAYASV